MKLIISNRVSWEEMIVGHSYRIFSYTRSPDGVSDNYINDCIEGIFTDRGTAPSSPNRYGLYSFNGEHFLIRSDFLEIELEEI